MKKITRTTCAAIAAGLFCLTALGGCASEKQPVATESESADEQANTNANSLGEFSLQDIEGQSYTQEMFQEYDLTMVNVFTTWCTPCINEIPDLEQLHQDMKEQGVGIVGIVLDAAEGMGGSVDETIEQAKLLAEKTGATYPFLVPDTGLLNGRLSRIDAVPETFFVDQNGAIVGETYTGSRSYDDWKSVIEDTLGSIGDDAS